MGCATLELAGRWVELALSVETEIFGRALANCYYVGLGRLWWARTWLFHLRGSGLTPVPGQCWHPTAWWGTVSTQCSAGPHHTNRAILSLVLMPLQNEDFQDD